MGGGHQSDARTVGVCYAGGCLMEDINLMREFVRLVECRNYTLVAKEFFVSQPTMTKHVQRLEAEFGTPLVLRTTHAVEITDAGLAVCEGFRQIIADYEHMVDRVEATRRGAAGQLRLGVLYHGLAELVLPLVAKFSSLHPEVQVSFVSCQSHEAYEALLAEKLDVAVVLENDSVAGVDFVATSRPRLLCAVGSASELACREAIARDEVAPLDWHYLSRDITLSMVERLGLPYRRLVAMENIDELPVSLSKPGSFTVLDEHLDGKLGPGVKLVPFDPPLARASYGVACRAADARSAVRSFMEMASDLAF